LRALSFESVNDYKVLKNPKKVDPDTKKDPKGELLDIIIEHINERFNGIFTEGDKVIVETMFDKIIDGDKKLLNKLKRQAKNNNVEIFQDNIFPKIFKDIANECYMEQMDAFTKLFKNRDFYDAIMAEIGRETYRELRNQ